MSSYLMPQITPESSDFGPKVAGVATYTHLSHISRSHFTENINMWVLNRANPLHPLQPATIPATRTRGKGRKTPGAAVELPLLDYPPMVSVCLELGGEIVEITADPAAELLREPENTLP